MRSLSEEVSVIVFYGIEHSARKIEAFYRSALRWFESLGLRPDRMGVSSDGRSNSDLSFARLSKKLSEEGFASLTGFEMYAAEPNAKIWYRDAIVSVDYEGTMNGTHACLTVNNSVATIYGSTVVRIAGEMANVLSPVYGVGFVRGRQFGPSLYAIGVLAGPAGHVADGEEYEENLRVCRWGDVAMPEQAYRRGLIRDVFLLNFLSKMHLERKIQGIPLGHWIAKDSRRGKLSSVSDDLWSWSIAPEQVQPIRESLQKEGVIFDWKKWPK